MSGENGRRQHMASGALEESQLTLNDPCRPLRGRTVTPPIPCFLHAALRIAGVRAGVRVRVRARACARARVRVRSCAGVRAGVRVRLRACARARVRACACVRVCIIFLVGESFFFVLPLWGRHRVMGGHGGCDPCVVNKLRRMYNVYHMS